MFSQVLIISTDRDSTTILGKLCQCFTILTVKKCFLVFKLNFLFLICVHSLSCQCALLRKLCLVHLQSPHQMITYMGKNPLEPPLLQVEQLHVSKTLYSSPIIILVAFHWLYSSKPIYFLYWRLQKWHRTPRLSRGERSPSSTCWPQSRRLSAFFVVKGHCWFKSTCCPPGPWFCLYKAAFQAVFPLPCVLVHVVIPSQVQDFRFPFFEFHEVSVGPFLQPV